MLEYPQDTESKLCALEIQSLVKSAADQIFSRLALNCPQFATLAIRLGRYACKFESGKHAFLRSKKIDLHGHAAFVGEAIEPHMLKHYESCVEVLKPTRFPSE